MENVVDAFRRFLALWRGARGAKPSDLQIAIMRVHRVQTWFRYHRGAAMARLPCPTCGEEKLFTIWGDGKYYCLPCLYIQVNDKRDEPVPLGTRESTMWDFSRAWLAYKRRIEALETPWVPPTGSVMIRLALIARVRPPSICDVGVCDLCGCFRPFMRREDGDAGCVPCLMSGRIVEIDFVVDETAAA